MFTLAFWKNWPKAEQFFLAFLGVLFITALAVFWYSYEQNPAPAISWDQYEEIQSEELTSRTFSVGLFPVPVKVDNFFVFETRLGSTFYVSPGRAYVNLALIMFSISILLTIITTLKRFWFLAGMTIFSLFCVSLSLETTEILEQSNKYPTFVVLFTLIAICYYFQAFGTGVTFFKRLAVIGGVFIVTAISIGWLANAPLPFLHITSHSYTFSIGLTLVFILMIGHEIPAAFINLITRGTRQTKSLQHFLIITVFYVLNLILTYAQESGYLSWGLWTVNIFLLFTISAVLSIWGFVQRIYQYENTLSSESLAAYLILALSIIACSTLCLLMASANDNALEVLHDVILYSHLGYGIIFIFYVLANFGSMLSQNLQVYKVLYKPNVMFYTTFRIMGLIACVAFMLYDTSYRTLLDQLYASYYNSRGDLYYEIGADQTAESYYNKSILYRNQNHHAHYALASIQENRLDYLKKKAELAAICDSNPSEYAFINLSETFYETDGAFQALFLLNQAKKKFPTSGVINNALGVAFSRLNVADSALLSFQIARSDKKIRIAAETNLLAASAKFHVNYPADSLLKLVGTEKEGALANALALANMQQIPIENKFIANADTVWTPTRVTYLCNYFINQAATVDTSLVKQTIEIARKPINEYYREAVIVAAAQALYQQGKVKQAFDLTREMAFASGRGRYYALLGYWALEQNNPNIAATYFEIAKEKKVAGGLLHQALAHTEADSLPLAKPLWDSLARIKNNKDSAFVRTLVNVLNANSNAIHSFTDVEKYWYCRYKVHRDDSTRLFSIINTIANSEIKTKAILDAAKKWYQYDELEIAATYLNKIEQFPINKETGDELLIYRLLLLAQLDAETFNQQKITFDKQLISRFTNEVILLKTWQSEMNGADVTNNYQHLSQANTYFEDGLVAAATFFANDTTDRLKPYSILVSGLMARPNSIKLLKAHTRYASLIGFDNEASESLEKLRHLLQPRAFNQFVTENPDIFTVQD